MSDASFPTGVERVHAHIDREFPRHLSRAQEFLRQPSISVERLGLQETARWLQADLQALGAHVQMAGDPLAPILVGRFDLGQPKTLIVYLMYDVQPVSGQAWTSPPFAAEIRERPGLGPCIIARGACNSKGPLVGFLNALHACREAGRIPVNLVLTIEGEEEIGSPVLPRFYQENRAVLQADAGFEPFWAEYGTDVDRPTLTLGSKGILTLELICRGGAWGGPTEHTIHSSVGAWLASPSWRLVKALGTLVDDDEGIRIPGFPTGAAPQDPDDEELLRLLAPAWDEASILASMSAARFKFDTHGPDLLRRYFFAPSLHIGRFTIEDGDVISPEVRVEVHIRLAPGMAPDWATQAVRTHLASQGYGDIEVRQHLAYPASRTSLHAEVVQALLAAYRQHGVQPQIWPVAPSATPYYLFSEVLGLPYAWGGLGQAGGSHGPDEFASVDGLKLFEKSLVTFLHQYAQA
jgi:acetylornithine deacetylase/succinyl-diaminopimelate desuccinylase-like protein